MYISSEHVVISHRGAHIEARRPAEVMLLEVAHAVPGSANIDLSGAHFALERLQRVVLGRLCPEKMQDEIVPQPARVIGIEAQEAVIAIRQVQQVEALVRFDQRVDEGSVAAANASSSISP
jgi:hypothetical protein